VDTTGAGDAFVAGILSQLAVDLSLLQVLLFRYR
jgi:fructokinase